VIISLKAIFVSFQLRIVKCIFNIRSIAVKYRFLHIFLYDRYRGHCPTTKYDYGETYGNATSKYFQDYRSQVLYNSVDPYCKGGEFPTYYTHKPETVISNRSRTQDRWIHAPKYSLSNIDFDRKEELYSFDKVLVFNY